MLFRRLVFAVLLGAAALFVPCGARADDDDRLSPCADLLQTADAGSPCVVDAGRAVLQLAVTRERGEETRILYPLALLRFGVHRGTEFHVVLPSVQRTFDDAGATRSADFSLGLKHIVVAGRTTVAFVADGTFATGDASAGAPTWRGGFSLGYAANRRVNLVANFAVARGSVESGDRTTRIISGLGMELEPSEGTELEIEIVKDGARSSELEANIQRLVGRNVAVRLGFGRGSSPNARSSSVSFGLTLLK